MSILKLKPSCKDYLWGGHRLVEEYGKEYEGEIETWALELQKIEPDSKAAQSEDVIEDEAVPLKDVSGKR